jgi:hypothetical protein
MGCACFVYVLLLCLFLLLLLGCEMFVASDEAAELKLPHLAPNRWATGCACVLVLQLLDLDIAEDEAAELKPVAAALQRLTGG